MESITLIDQDSRVNDGHFLPTNTSLWAVETAGLPTLRLKDLQSWRSQGFWAALTAFCPWLLSAADFLDEDFWPGFPSGLAG